MMHALQTILKRQIDEKVRIPKLIKTYIFLNSTLGDIYEFQLLFSRESSYFPSHLSFDNVILTFNMRRLYFVAIE